MKGFGKDSHKTILESFKCWDLVRLILRDLTVCSVQKGPKVKHCLGTPLFCADCWSRQDLSELSWKILSAHFISVFYCLYFSDIVYNTDHHIRIVDGLLNGGDWGESLPSGQYQCKIKLIKTAWPLDQNTTISNNALTHWTWDEMAFLNSFSWMEILI